MTEHSSLPTRRDGGKPPPLTAQPGMSHGIHASVDPVQPSCCNPPCDARLRQTRTKNLGKGHDAVLSRGYCGTDCIRRCELVPHTGTKSHGGVRAPLNIRAVAATPSVSAQYSVVVRVELDARQEP